MNATALKAPETRSAIVASGGNAGQRPNRPLSPGAALALAWPADQQG